MRINSGLFVAVAAGVLTVGSVALAVPTLSPITMPGYSSTQGRAMTPDGKYIVGTTDTGSGTSKEGWIWDATNGVRQIPAVNGLAAAKCTTGVGYRMVGGNRQVVVHGQAGSYDASWISADGGATWTGMNHTDGGAGSTPGGVANSLAGNTTSDTWYQSFWGGATNNIYVSKGSGSPAAYSTGTFTFSGSNWDINGISSTGVGAGYYNNRNALFTYNGTGSVAISYFNGLAGTTTGEAWAISGDGTKVFGRSPTSTSDSGHRRPYMYTVGGSAVALPGLTTPAAGNTYNSFGLVYGASQDGRYAVGWDYTYGAEHAVLWDTQAMTVLDLTTFASQNGILGSFNSLGRAYSVGVNEAGQPVITGGGSAPGIQSGLTAYALTLPEPGSLVLLAVGGLAALRRRLA